MTAPKDAEIQVRPGDSEEDPYMVQLLDTASGSWSEWREQGEVIQLIRDRPGGRDTIKRIKHMVILDREKRAATASHALPAEIVTAAPPAADPSLDEKVERLRAYLQQHPGTRLMDLEQHRDAERGPLYILAKKLLERGELHEHPKTRALLFKDQRPPVELDRPSDVNVRVMEDLPPIAGSKQVFELKAGQVATLPESMARALIKRGKVEEVRDFTPAPEDVPTAAPEAPVPIMEEVRQVEAKEPCIQLIEGSDDVVGRQRKWLEKLQAVQDAQTREPRPILVQHFKEDTWHPWMDCQHRSRTFTNGTLLSELVFDFDTEDWTIIQEEGGKLLQYLVSERVPYILAWSGGKGAHAHIFANLRTVELDPAVGEHLEDRADYGIDVPMIVRRALFDHLVEKAGIDAGRAKLDPLKVNFSSRRRGSMVRSFGCLRPAGERYAGGVKTLLDTIPEERPRPGELPLRFPETIELWDVGSLSQVINDALRAELTHAGREAFTPQAVEGPLSSIPCYSRLLTNGAVEGMRNKGAFAVALFNRVHGRPIEEARNEVRAYSAACPRPSAELEREHQGVLEGVYQRDYHGVSCKMMRQDFGEVICDKVRCPKCVSAKSIKSKDQAERLIELAEQGGRSEFFRDEKGEPHIRAMVGDHFEIMGTRSTRFRLWLSSEMYRAEGKAPRGEAVKAALDELSARGLFRGEMHPLSLRVAEHDGAIWLDMCDDRWRAIRIAAEGWQIVDGPPILFRRYKHMMPLEEPKASDGTALRSLAQLANLGEIDREHFKVQLIADLIPGIVQPGQYVSGGQGSGKTWIGRIEKLMIDPAVNVSNSLPKKVESLELLLDHNYIVCVGNLTRISDEVSDMFSCAITGDARRSRTLYTDDDESFKLYRRILRLDGIANAVRLSDLMNRLIYRYAPRIEGTYIDDKVMEAQILELRPHVLHELLDLLVRTIEIRPSMKKPTWTPRMSGWYMWAQAASVALGNAPEWFEETFKPYIERQDSEALDGDMLAEALRFIGGQGLMSTSTELWDRLQREDVIRACKIDTRDSSWPKSAKLFGQRLPMIAPNLAEMGVHVYLKLSYSEAHTKFGDAIYKIPKGRDSGDYVKQDRMIILSPRPLIPKGPPEAGRSTHLPLRSTDGPRTQEGIC